MRICVKNTNSKDTHATRVPENKHSCIPTYVSAYRFPPHMYPPLFPVSRQSSLQWEALPLLPRPHVFLVLWPLQLGCNPHLTSPSTPCSVYYSGDLQPPPLLQQNVCSTVNESMYPFHGRGGFWRGISSHHHKASLKSSLVKSVPPWDLGRMVSHPPPSQAHYRFCIAFLSTVSFRDLIPPLLPIQPPLPPRLTPLPHLSVV